MVLRKIPSFNSAHTNGYRALRYRCPLLFPQATGETCEHEQFLKGKGCQKEINDEPGGRARLLMDRTGPLYHAIYNQRMRLANASIARPKNLASNDHGSIMDALSRISIP
jgi:hypothetical protein